MRHLATKTGCNTFKRPFRHTHTRLLPFNFFALIKKFFHQTMKWDFLVLFTYIKQFFLFTFFVYVSSRWWNDDQEDRLLYGFMLVFCIWGSHRYLHVHVKNFILYISVTFLWCTFNNIIHVRPKQWALSHNIHYSSSSSLLFVACE